MAGHRSPIPYEERFWSRVDRSGGPDACWPWTKTRDKDGYGVWRYGRRSGVRAPRIAWALSHGGEWPGSAQWVLHRCDNPPCLNPAHLWLGSPSDNVQDMLAKGRFFNGDAAAHFRRTSVLPRGDRHYTKLHPEKIPIGDRHHATVVTDDDVRVIRARYAAGGVLQRELAVEYGVSKQHISAIIRRKFRTHV